MHCVLKIIVNGETISAFFNSITTYEGESYYRDRLEMGTSIVEAVIAFAGEFKLFEKVIDLLWAKIILSQRYLNVDIVSFMEIEDPFGGLVVEEDFLMSIDYYSIFKGLEHALPFLGMAEEFHFFVQ